MRLIKLIIIVVILSLGLWCGIYGNSTSENKNMSYGMSIMIDKISYSVGEPIMVTLKIINYTEEDIVFQFNTFQRYDFIIEDEKGNEIWRWSQDMMFAMVLGEEILGPISPEIIYTAEYKGELVPGYYKVTGIFVVKDRPMSGNVIIIVK